MKYWQALPFAMAALVMPAQALNRGIPTVPPPPSAPGLTTLGPLQEVENSTKAVNYGRLKGSVDLGFNGTTLAPKASGAAEVKSKPGGTVITARFKNMPPPSSFGGEFLTYALWGVSTEGQATNLGELVIENGKGKIKATDQLQTFAMVVTAEPYFAVTYPSEVVVMENAVRADAATQVEIIDTKYQLVKRDQYSLDLGATMPIAVDKKTPFDIHQARNALRIARESGAPTHAREGFEKAQASLLLSETEGSSRASRTMEARASVQSSEDARLISVRQWKIDLDASNKQMAQVQADNIGLRTGLLAEFDAVLQTRATARGLIVNMTGALFENGKATVLPNGREKLAKIARILSTHKGLMIEADGYTDSTGTADFDLRLSENRAENARDCLVSQGVSPNTVSYRGFGMENPVASNETSSGRQENRRVELVVSGAGTTDFKTAGM